MMKNIRYHDTVLVKYGYGVWLIHHNVPHIQEGVGVCIWKVCTSTWLWETLVIADGAMVEPAEVWLRCLKTPALNLLQFRLSPGVGYTLVAGHSLAAVITRCWRRENWDWNERGMLGTSEIGYIKLGSEANTSTYIQLIVFTFLRGSKASRLLSSSLVYSWLLHHFHFHFRSHPLCLCSVPHLIMHVSKSWCHLS